MTLADFAAFQSLLERQFGFYLNAEQTESLERGVGSRLQALRLGRIEHYLRYLECADDGHEARRLAALLANGETHFLRVPEHFAVLRQHLLPTLLQRRPRSIRIWSAACATGEEAYSIAMAVRELVPTPADTKFEILGTDLSESALETARAGYYASRSLRGLDEERLARYFDAEGSGYRVKPELRCMVRFAYLNLMGHPLPFASENWDVIFCRNVLLYFREAQACKVVSELEKVLADDGYLLSAPSESMRNLSARLRVEQMGGVFIYRKGRMETLLANLRLPRLMPGRRPVASREAVAAEPAAASGWQQDYSRGMAALAAGDLGPEMLAEIQALWAKHPGRAQAGLLLTRAYLATGQAEQAQAAAGELCERNPLLAAAHFVLGLALVQQGLPSESVEHYRRAIYLDADFFPAHYHLARAYRAVGNYRRARVAYRNALAVLERVPYPSWEEYAEKYSYEEWAFTCRQSLQAVEALLTRRVAGLPA